MCLFLCLKTVFKIFWIFYLKIIFLRFWIYGYNKKTHANMFSLICFFFYLEY
jgi:hypothetical protein